MKGHEDFSKAGENVLYLDCTDDYMVLTSAKTQSSIIK